MGRLRSLLDRPLPEAPRERAKLVASMFALLLVVAAVLIAVAPVGAGSGGEERTAAPVPPPEEPALRQAEPIQGAGAETFSSLPPDDLAADARPMMQSWAAVYYGRARPRSLEHVTPQLRRAIAQGVNTALRKRRPPRVTALRVEPKGERFAVHAQIDDGSRYGAFPVGFLFEKQGGEWIAVDKVDDL